MLSKRGRRTAVESEVGLLYPASSSLAKATRTQSRENENEIWGSALGAQHCATKGVG